MTQPSIPFQTAGTVDIHELVIFTGSGKFLDIKDYMSELNIYEDIFSPTMSGNFLFVDSRNLIKELPIVGEEYLYAKIETPSSGQLIEKIFRIYSITDREFANDQGTQIYSLNFISLEAIANTFKPIFKTFKGQISALVRDIFNDYIQTKRTAIKKDNAYTFNNDVSKLQILTSTSNSVKFVSPGWTPFKCINWCASKSIPLEGKACNFLFFETNKAFVFGSIETIFKFNKDSNNGLSIGTYKYQTNQLKKNENPVSKMFNVEEFQLIKTVDHLANYNSGYLANRLITLDILNKKYAAHDYDAIESFEDYSHSEAKPKPFFNVDSTRSPLSDIKFAPVHPGLFPDMKDNVNEKMFEIHGNRKSNLMELNNFKLNMIIPGRTDVEVGRTLDFIFPDVSPKSEKDKNKDTGDKFYTGSYLISAIRHKITLQSHHMAVELIKDSMNGARDN
ncbi:hypothetical protein [Marinobacter sp.]|uniref:hypothetical protein n=1 Tax=Marinobacter sp. TaxID=50741 RepID=UPI00257A3D73|nr:hypothetical protein [Marinobacter sp.]|tara:strand:- start:1921 stop:3264 length:1344 start_codon:yes stop_codon:yes gene_type:complete